jgi:hypothetical protein
MRFCALVRFAHNLILLTGHKKIFMTPRLQRIFHPVQKMLRPDALLAAGSDIFRHNEFKGNI